MLCFPAWPCHSFYPTITSWFGPAGDYRKAYGLDDILYVWIIAAIAAFIIWFLGVLIRWGCLRLCIPQENDDPRRLLAKFARRLWSRNLRHRSAMYDDAERVIIVGSSIGKELVTPAIAYTNISLPADKLGKLQGYTSAQPLRLSCFLWRYRRRSLLPTSPKIRWRSPPLSIRRSSQTSPRMSW